MSLGAASSPLPGPRTRPPGTVGVRTWPRPVRWGQEDMWGVTARELPDLVKTIMVLKKRKSLRYWLYELIERKLRPEIRIQS